MYRNVTFTFSLLLLLLTPAYLRSEEFRGNPKAVVAVTPENKAGTTVSLLMGDLLFIYSDDPYAFLQGVELEVHPPAAAVQEAFAISVTLHHALDSFPGTEPSVIVGDLLLREELQPANRFYYRVPLTSEVTFHRQADTRVLSTVVTPSEERPLTMGFWPRMKAMPSAIRDKSFDVTVRPLIADRGGARVVLLDSDSAAPISVREDETDLYIDGDRVASTEEIIFLSSGLHRLRVSSDRFVRTEATFAVEPGEIATVRMELQPLTTEVRFAIPDAVELYLNGTPLDHREGSAELPVGEHLVVLELGGFTVQQTIILEAGKSYELGLDLDLFLQEN